MKQLDIHYAFGIATGVALAFSIVCILNFLPAILHVETLHKWQELIGVVGAIFAAGLALVGIWWQVRHVQLEEENKRERQAYAARAMMAHALSSICEHADSSVRKLQALFDGRRPPKDPEQVTLPETFDLLPISKLPLAPLEQILQSGEKPVQDRVASLMQQLQIQHSRLLNCAGHVVGNEVFARWYYMLLSNALELHAAASALFRYARGDVRQVPPAPSATDMRGAAIFFGLDEKRWSELHRFLAQDWKPRTFFTGTMTLQ